MPLAARLARAVALLALLPSLAAAQNATPVAKADLDKLMGRWYEIARLPVEREQACASELITEYEPRTESAFRINISCRTADNLELRHNGVARIRDRFSHAKFEVRFAPLAFAWLPFVWEDLWVLEAPPTHDYLMVGAPDHGSLWIYARKPVMDDTTYRQLVAHATAQGYDTSQLLHHAGSSSSR